MITKSVPGEPKGETGSVDMGAIERIAYNVGRRDEVPNQELAAELAASKDADGIAEIADHLEDKNKSVASDCLKVMYEIGYIDPTLIEPYTGRFLGLLRSPNNRMVWGSMIALWTVAAAQADVIWKEVDLVMDTVREGTVITTVSGVKALAVVASKSPAYEARIGPFLMDVLRDCEPKLVATHAEDMLVMVDDGNRDEMVSVLEGRMDELRSSQATRVRRVLRRLR